MASAFRNDKCSAALLRVICLLPAVLAGCQTATSEREPDLNRYLGAAARNDRAVVAGGGGATNVLTNDATDPARMDADAAMTASKALRADGRAREAVGALERASGEGATAGAGRNPALDLELGRARIGAGDAPGAVTPLRRYVERRPDDWRGAVALGVALDLSGMNGDAMAQYERALRLSPGNPAILNNMALSKALSGRLDEATALLREASESADAPEKVRGNLELVRGLKAGG